MVPRALAGACLSLTATVLLAAGSDDDSSIPPLAPEVFDSWWPGLEPHLPHGFASVSGGMVSPGGAEEGPMLEGSAWAGELRHPSPRWSYGAALGYSDRHWGLGPEFPAESHNVRLAVGAWRRFSLDDHLVLVAAPGIGWARTDTGAAISVPLAGLWLHRQNRHLVWGFGAIALFGAGRPVALPVAGAVVFDGPWTYLLTPIALSADRLLTADASLGVFAGLGGDYVPVEIADQQRWASYWDVRTGLRFRDKLGDHLSVGAEAGCAVVRRANLSDAAVGGDRIARASPAPAPYAALTATWSW
jgi:hypothetical protein